jgi:hypothetical protein
VRWALSGRSLPVLVGLGACLSVPPPGAGGGQGDGDPDAAVARPCPVLSDPATFDELELGPVAVAAAGPLDSQAAGARDDLVIIDHDRRVFTWSSGAQRLGCTTLADLGIEGRPVGLALGPISRERAGAALVVRRSTGQGEVVLLAVDVGAIVVVTRYPLERAVADGAPVVVALTDRAVGDPRLVAVGADFALESGTLVGGPPLEPGWVELIDRTGRSSPPIAVVSWANPSLPAGARFDLTAVWGDAASWRQAGGGTVTVALAEQAIAGAFVDVSDDDCVDFVGATTVDDLWLKPDCSVGALRSTREGPLGPDTLVAAPLRVPTIDTDRQAQSLAAVNRLTASSVELEVKFDSFVSDDGNDLLFADGETRPLGMTAPHLVTGDFFDLAGAVAGADEILLLEQGGFACFQVQAGNQIAPCPI